MVEIIVTNCKKSVEVVMRFGVIFCFFICKQIAFAQMHPYELPETDSMKRFHYDFSFFNGNDLRITLTGMSTDFVNKEHTIRQYSYYHADGSLEAQEISYLNSWERDSVAYTYINGKISDSTTYKYDKQQRILEESTYELLTKDYSKSYYFYRDTIFPDSMEVTEVTEYRALKRDGEIDSSFSSSSRSTYDHGKLIRVIDFYADGDQIENEFFYNDKGELLDVKVKTDDELVRQIQYDYLNPGKTECSQRYTVPFPDVVTNGSSKELKKILCEYVGYFDDFEQCRKKSVVFESPDKRCIISLVRGACLSRGAGSIELVVNF